MDASTIKDVLDDYLRELEFEIGVRDGVPVLRVWRLFRESYLAVIPLPVPPKETP